MDERILIYFNRLVDAYDEALGNELSDDLLWEEHFMEFAQANRFMVLIGPDQYTRFEDGDIILCPDEHPSDLYFVQDEGYFKEVVGGKLSPSRITQKFFFQKWDSEDNFRHYLLRLETL